MASAEDLLSKQRKLSKAAGELGKYADDPKKLLEMAAEITKGAKELEEAALRFQAENDPATGGALERVVLTADQRARLAEQTGVYINHRGFFRGKQRHKMCRVIRRGHSPPADHSHGSYTQGHHQ